MSRHEPVPPAAAPTVNIANVLAVADAIERHEIVGLGFNMREFFAAADNWLLRDLSGRECGTCACIAGWTVAVFGRGTDQVKADATDLLGLDDDQADRLFYQFDEDGKACGPGGQFATDGLTFPAQAVRTLRHLAATAMQGAPVVVWDLPAEPLPALAPRTRTHLFVRHFRREPVVARHVTVVTGSDGIDRVVNRSRLSVADAAALVGGA